jgi:hypothetical protein
MLKWPRFRVFQATVRRVRRSEMDTRLAVTTSSLNLQFNALSSTGDRLDSRFL